MSLTFPFIPYRKTLSLFVVLFRCYQLFMSNHFCGKIGMSARTVEVGTQINDIMI